MILEFVPNKSHIHIGHSLVLGLILKIWCVYLVVEIGVTFFKDEYPLQLISIFLSHPFLQYILLNL